MSKKCISLKVAGAGKNPRNLYDAVKQNLPHLNNLLGQLNGKLFEDTQKAREFYNAISGESPRHIFSMVHLWLRGLIDLVETSITDQLSEIVHKLAQIMDALSRQASQHMLLYTRGAQLCVVLQRIRNWQTCTRTAFTFTSGCAFVPREGEAPAETSSETGKVSSYHCLWLCACCAGSSHCNDLRSLRT